MAVTLELNEANIRMAKDKIRNISMAFSKEQIRPKIIYQRKHLYGEKTITNTEILFHFVWSDFLYKEIPGTRYITITDLRNDEIIADNQ